MVQLQTTWFPIHKLQLIYLYLYNKLWFIYISKHALFIFSLRNYANEHAYTLTNYFPEITKFLAIMMFINKIASKKSGYEMSKIAKSSYFF